MLASRKSRESREMARRSFYSTRRQCRCCQEVVVGDAEDVPSSMIAVEVEGLEKLVVVPVQVTFHVCQVPKANNSTNVRPSYLVPVPGPCTSRDRDETRDTRVAKQTFSISLKAHTDASSSFYTLFLETISRTREPTPTATLCSSFKTKAIQWRQPRQ